MSRMGIGSLPVFRDGQPVGTVPIGGIAAKSHQRNLSAELIERLSQPYQPILE